MVYRDGKKVDPSKDPEDDSGGKSNLVSRSMLPEGTKVGDDVKFKVIHLYDDEAEVEYAHSRKDKDDDSDKLSEPETPDMDAANSDLDALATPSEA